MSDMYRKITLVILTIFVVSCAAQPRIVRHPEPADFTKDSFDLTSIPIFDPDSPDAFQVDLRSRDLTKIDMRSSLADLMYAVFDSKTQWPTADKMPVGFDWQKIMELNKDPGLGVRALHKQGITGKGVSIAIIDQTLLVDHIEYEERLRLYEETEDIRSDAPEARLHGAAVASISVGNSIGVAPEADLYFIGTGFCGAKKLEDIDYACWAKAVRRIVEINKSLSIDRKIRVLSLSWGWNSKSINYEEIRDAVNEAKAAGIFVISSSLGRTDNLNFQGLGRDPLSNPNDFWGYRPGLWWQKSFYQQGLASPTLLVPMDSRTTASPTGTEDYVYYRQGGWSWCIPYLAGTYALAVQVKPDITPEQFWENALNTGKTIHIGHRGRDYKFGVILDPQALIEAIKSK
jgi:subtilisin family serine protease